MEKIGESANLARDLLREMSSLLEGAGRWAIVGVNGLAGLGEAKVDS